MDQQTHFTVKGLVIKEMNVGESDRLVTLFTAELGIIKAFASGAKNVKSRKLSATSLLTYSDFSIKRKGNSLKIYEATPISFFFEMGMDITVLTLSQYFCELAYEFGTSSHDNEFFRLILNSLHFLTKEKRNPYLIKAIIELRIAAISGYMPDLVACENCGKFEENIMYFNLDDGSIMCNECKCVGDFTAVDRTVLTAMRHIVYSEFKNLYSFEIPEPSAKILSNITGEFLKRQTEQKFSALEFFDKIKE